MSRAQRRRIEKQRIKAERLAARRAAASERRRRQDQRWAADMRSDLLWALGRLLWDLAWAPLSVWIWPMAQIGRLMGIDTRDRPPPSGRPVWRQAQDQRPVVGPDHAGLGRARESAPSSGR